MPRYTPEQLEAVQAASQAVIGEPGRSANLLSEAVALQRAIAAESPVLYQRLQRLTEHACEDGVGAACRESLAAALLALSGEERSEVIRLRLTPSERARLDAAAQGAGQTLSAYVRDRCGL